MKKKKTEENVDRFTRIIQWVEHVFCFVVAFF